MEKIKSDRKPLSLHATYILCGVILVIATFFVYYLSNDSKVHVLACDGNYYYTDQEIYKSANVSTDTRIWLTPSGILKSRITKQPLVEKVDVKKRNGKIAFTIQEKLGIAYYIEKGKTYVLTVDNESIEIDEEHRSCLEHLPFMSGFNAKQRKQIASEYKLYEEDLSKEIFEKISEITPFKTSYDNNMVRMVMVDGNVVYSNMSSLSMITKYQAVLTQLQGKSVCLVLDADHNAIDKVDCNTMTTSRKDLPKEPVEEEEDEEDKNKDDDQDEDTENDDENDVEIDEDNIAASLDQVTDWQYDNSTGFELEYSPSTGYYRNPWTGEYYGWDDTTLSFIPITR